MKATEKTLRKASIHSEPTRALIRQKALLHGTKRSDNVKNRVSVAIKEIEREITENAGTYPYNKGVVSSAEVARRAGIHPTTFFSLKQRELGESVKLWLESIKSKPDLSPRPIRRELAIRIADWREAYEKLQQAYRDTELELQQAKAELLQANDIIFALQFEKEKLRQLIKDQPKENIVLLHQKNE